MPRMRIAHVSTFPPLKCGIASYVEDLIAALPAADNRRYALHYGNHAGTDADGLANNNSPTEVARLAEQISASDCDVVSLQHEFGIWGGRDGRHLEDFVRNIRQPVVSTLHTTFNRDYGTPARTAMIDLLVERSAFTVVLTRHAKATAEALLERSLANTVVLPHGIHTVPFVPPPSWPDASAADAPFRLITPGYFRENKGLETVLLALSRMVRDGIRATYRIAGEPQGQFPEQLGYVEWLQGLVRNLGLESAVHLDLKYLSLQEQVEAIRASHAGIFAYQAAEQSSSGTVPLALAAGRPAICTPFEFACAKAAEGSGVVVAEGYGFGAVERAIKSLMNDPGYLQRAADAHRMAETWPWPNVGARFADVCSEAIISSRPRVS